MNEASGQRLEFKIANAEKMRINAGGLQFYTGKTTPTDLHNTWQHLIIGEKCAIIELKRRWLLLDGIIFS